MNCDCIVKMPERIMESKPEFKGKKVVDVEFLSKALVFEKNMLKLITISELGYQIEGMKKKHIQNVMHSYCPFCGRKIKDDEPQIKGRN